MQAKTRFRYLAVGLIAVLLAIIVACGEEATPTSTPTGMDVDALSNLQKSIEDLAASQSGGLTAEQVQGIVSDAVTDVETLAASDVQSIVGQAIGAIDTPEGLTAEQVQTIVGQAMGDSPQAMTPAQVQEIVTNALAAAERPEGLTADEVQSIVQAAMVGAMSTPEAMPAETLGPAIMQPQGTLQVAMPEVGPAVFNNRDATYATLRFLMTTVGESMFHNDPNSQTTGRLVKDWTLDSTANGAVYTFHLQPGVKWHDNLGDWGEFNADDFLFNIDLVTDDGSVHAVKAGTLRAYLCDECTLTKIDDLTVQLQRPTESFEVFWYTKQPQGQSSASRAAVTSGKGVTRLLPSSPYIPDHGR